MKEFWVYTSTHIDSDGDFIKKIKKCKTEKKYSDTVDNMFNSDLKWS